MWGRRGDASHVAAQDVVGKAVGTATIGSSWPVLGAHERVPRRIVGNGNVVAARWNGTNVVAAYDELLETGGVVHQFQWKD